MSFAFPSLDFYQGEFETDRVNVLYDLLLSYPSPQYLAAIITEARKEPGAPQFDQQARDDALAALAILHYFLQDVSKPSGRWRDLARQLQAKEHYTSRVISARLLVSGELGGKDLGRALSFAQEANGLRQNYATDGGYKTMSPRNYALTSNRTLYDIVIASPRMSGAQFYLDFAKQYGATLRNPVLIPELETALGPGLRSIEKSSSRAAWKAGQLLKYATQGSLLKAEKDSLDSATRNRISDSKADINVDDKTMLAITRQLEKLSSLNDKQKQLFSSALVDVHDSGDKAIQMMPGVMNSAMNLMMNRGISAMPAIEPYVKKLQHYSDSACSVVSRWDQAAEVTKTPSNHSENSSSLAALVDESGH